MPAGENPRGINYVRPSSYVNLEAPLDNKGKPTGFDVPGQQPNTFTYMGGPIRVTDRKGKVLFSGEGIDAANEAIAFAKNLSETSGKKAAWDIQQGERTINTDGSVGEMRWISGPSDAPDGNEIGMVLDFALPIIMNAVIPGSGFLATMAGNALGAVASGVIQGKGIGDIATSAFIAGAVGGFTQQTGLDKAIGGALKDLGGNLAKNAIEEGVDEIVVTALSKAAQAAGGAAANTIIKAGISEITGFKTPAEKFVSEPAPIVVTGNRVSDALAGTVSGIGGGVTAGLGEVTGYKTPAEKFVEEPLPEELQPPVQPPLEDAIVVTAPKVTPVTVPVPGIGNPVVTDAIGGFDTPAEKFVEEPLPEELQPDDTIVVTGNGVSDAVAGTVSGIGGSAANAVINQPATTEPNKTAEQIEEERTGEIVALGDRITPVTVPVTGIGGFNLSPDTLAEIDRISDMENDQASDEIVVTGRETTVPTSVTTDSGLSGSLITNILPPLTSDPALTDDDNTLDTIKDVTDVVSAGLPLIPVVTGGGGGDGGTRPPDTTGLTFTEGTLTPTIPVGGIGGAGGYPYTPETYGRRGGDQETEYLFFTRDPVTGQGTVQSGTPVTTTGAAAAPRGRKEGGEINDDMVKHLVEYHKNGGHHGPGQVKGIGSGQDDKIPAYLSDGEYVWSAQDVSDLGDGSNDEGVRRLNKMRQMVRRQAGRKDVKKIAKPQKGIDTMLKAVGGMA